MLWAYRICGICGIVATPLACPAVAETKPAPVAKKVIVMVANKRHQSTRTLTHRSSVAGQSTSKSPLHRDNLTTWQNNDDSATTWIAGFKAAKKAKIEWNAVPAPPRVYQGPHKNWPKRMEPSNRARWVHKWSCPRPWSPKTVVCVCVRRYQYCSSLNSVQAKTKGTYVRRHDLCHCVKLSYCVLSELHVVPLKITENRAYCRENIPAKRLHALKRMVSEGSILMSVKLATYSYSFSASSCELHQNVYIGRSRHAEHEYDIRFALGQTVWPLEAIKVSENGVPHSVFVYRPNRFKMHHTTCRDPGQVDTQQKTGFQDVKVKGQGQICEKKHLF